MKPNITPVEAMDQLWQDYHGQWPPRSDFDDWPVCWQIYQEVCDEMPEHLCDGTSTPENFRIWMKRELTDKVQLDNVMNAIREHYSKDDMKLLGFFACLTFLKNAYRWGKLPAEPEERARTSLEFPTIIAEPISEIAKLHGTQSFGTMFSLHIANTVYEDNQAVGMRFRFNADPNVIRTEVNFLLPFVKMENIFQTAVADMREYMKLTKEAKHSMITAAEHLSKRFEYLRKIRQALTQAGKVFTASTLDSMIDKVDWAKFVQVPATWGLDGKGGASGGETFMFQLLDEFLHIPGKCLMYSSKPLRRENMVESVRDVLSAIAAADHTDRFDSFLGLDKAMDPIWQAKEALIKALHLWRLGHAHVVRRILSKSDGLASTLEKKMDVQKSVAETAEEELIKRARETIGQNISKSHEKNENVSLIGRYSDILKLVWASALTVVDFIGLY